MIDTATGECTNCTPRQHRCSDCGRLWNELYKACRGCRKFVLRVEVSGEYCDGCAAEAAFGGTPTVRSEDGFSRPTVFLAPAGVA